VKDVKKIPKERVYVMKTKFYWLGFDVEGKEEAGDNNNNNGDDNDGDDGKGQGDGDRKNDEHDGFDELEDMNETQEDNTHTPRTQFGSFPPQQERRHGAKSCPMHIHVAETNQFQPLVDFSLLDD
jgi:hypothetical protein